VGLEAVWTGTFAGDNYNDQPRSLQLADELQEQLIGLTAELRLRDARAARLESEIVGATVRFNDLAETKIVAPANASVWKDLTAPGEEVRRGPDLVRLLDCTRRWLRRGTWFTSPPQPKRIWLLRHPR
jgi:hypothetical protein